MTQIKINYVYEVLLILLKKEMHQREIAKELKTSLTRIQTILKELRDINAIDYKELGKNHTYFIKKNLISKSLILNAENYKLIKLLTKYNYLNPIFKEILQKIDDSMIILFGSFAKNLENKNSDIDIYIETSDHKIKELIQKIYPTLNVKIGGFNSKDILIKEIIKNHIIIRGAEKYYEKLEFFE